MWLRSYLSYLWTSICHQLSDKVPPGVGKKRKLFGFYVLVKGKLLGCLYIYQVVNECLVNASLEDG